VILVVSSSSLAGVSPVRGDRCPYGCQQLDIHRGISPGGGDPAACGRDRALGCWGFGKAIHHMRHTYRVTLDTG
jgi:hypothetical protein